MLIRLYPNSTQYYQPADRGLFKPLKALYKRFVDFNKAFNGKPLDKKGFAEVLGRIHKEIEKDWVINAFRTCGLYPWNPESISYEDLNIRSPPNDLSIGQTFDVVELQNMRSDNATFEIIDQSIAPNVDDLQTVDINDSSVVENEQRAPDQSENNVCTDSETQNMHQSPNDDTRPMMQHDTRTCVIENIESPSDSFIVKREQNQGSAAILFRRAKSYYSTDSHYTEGLKILGPELLREFENPNFLEAHESKTKLFEMYQMLKRKEEERLQPLSLPQHTQPKRKGKMVQKRHFVSVSEDYIDVMGERKRKKEEEESAKKKRKLARDEKKSLKENAKLIKVEPDAVPTTKRRGRPRKTLKEINVID